MAVCLSVLGLLLLAWFALQRFYEEPGQDSRVSVLDVQFAEPEFSPKASANDLLKFADREIQQLLRDFPNSDEPHNVKANRDYLVSDTASAHTTWKKAAELNPKSYDARFGLAMLAFEGGRYEETIGLCDELMRLSPGNPRVPLLQADAFIHTARADRAILTLEQHLATEHASVQALEMLGNAYMHVKNFAQAIVCFEQALQFAPESKDSLYGLGRAYVLLGNREKAAGYISRFESQAKSTGEAHSEDAQAFKDRDHAAHVAAQVLADSALAYKRMGDLKTVEEKLLRANRLQPDVLQWLEELQRVLAARGRRHEAVDVGMRLVELAPKNVEHWLNLGQLCAETERHQQALEAYRKAIALAPDDQRCQQARSVIQRLERS